MDPILKVYQLRDEEAREEVRTHKNPPARFRASELADCKRAVYYRQTGHLPAPRTGFDNDWSRDGDIHHDLIRQELLHYGIELAGITQNEDGTTEEDRYVVHDFEYEGRTLTVSTRQDGWIKHEDYGWMLMEIKSAGHWIYHYIAKAYFEGWRDKDGKQYKAGEEAVLAYLLEKKPSYLYQMMAGLAIARARGAAALPFDESEPHTLDKSYLVLKDRSNCHYAFFPEDDQPPLGGIVMTWSDEVWEIVLKRMYHTRGKILDGKVPLPEYTPGSNTCRNCKYRYLCHDADKRRKQGLEPAVVYPDPEVRFESAEAPVSED